MLLNSIKNSKLLFISINEFSQCKLIEPPYSLVCLIILCLKASCAKTGYIEQLSRPTKSLGFPNDGTDSLCGSVILYNTLKNLKNRQKTLTSFAVYTVI